MSAGKREPQRFQAMLQERADSTENTRKKLEQALDRFENNQLIKLPPGTKLTVRTLATEAEVNKDTPLSRYPKEHSKAKQYRFPKVVARFKKLTAKKIKTPPEDPKDKENKKLRESIKEKDEEILLMARVNNQLDAENVRLERRDQELEKEIARLRDENAQLRQGNIRGLPTKK
jgi:hypothetical protein